MLIITVLSFAFQISGAIILLNWSVSNLDNRIKAKCFDQHTSLTLETTSDGIKIRLRKDDLQRYAIELYKSVVAIANILIGYSCAIFMEDNIVSKYVTLLLVVVAVAAILLVEKLVIEKLARKKYNVDLLLGDKEYKIPYGMVAFKKIEGNEDET